MSDPSSPYAPPQADLRTATPSGPVERHNVDPGEALSYPFQTSGWIGKVLVVGLCFLVPLIGPVLALGWQRHIFERVRAGDPELPTIEGADLGRGFGVILALFLNFLPFVMVGVVGMLLFGFALDMSQENGGGQLDDAIAGVAVLAFYAVVMVGTLAFQLMMPELLRRAFLGDMNIVFNPGPSLRAIKRATGPFAIAMLTAVMANMLGSLGVFLCYVGLLASFPLSYAMAGNAIGQYQQVLDTRGVTG